jgi:hypothetical protein
MGKRHDAIGIKQVTRLEWYDFTLDMLLSGQPAKEIRIQLDDFISERLQSGGFGERGAQTYTKAVTQIMKSWVSPARELLEFRNNALEYARSNKTDSRLTLHWAVTIAAYPFWHQVAHQVGRLLNLQEIVTQGQIRTRCFESMGERTTVERSARRVIRSFVVWGVLHDADEKGCYKKSKPITIVDHKLATILIEAILHATKEGRGAIESFINSPALFPFQLPSLTGDYIAQVNKRIEVNRYGLDDEMLTLVV